MSGAKSNNVNKFSLHRYYKLLKVGAIKWGSIPNKIKVLLLKYYSV